MFYIYASILLKFLQKLALLFEYPQEKSNIKFNYAFECSLENQEYERKIFFFFF